MNRKCMRAQWHALIRTHAHIHTISVVFAEHFPLATEKKYIHHMLGNGRRVHFANTLPTFLLLLLFSSCSSSTSSHFDILIEIRVYKNMFCVRCSTFYLWYFKNELKDFLVCVHAFVRQLIFTFFPFPFSSSKTSYTFFTTSDSKIRLAKKNFFCL